ncbi:MAG TPA: helix-turn-helix domain-containing protein [Terriglobia bacterium]|nr:helix-turn-helix domain-containing protein [Terriglobia bacterium]
MFFRAYNPNASLSDFVENFWAYSFNSVRLRERIFPSGTFELVFNLHDNQIRIYEGVQSNAFQRYSGAVISGPHAGPIVTDTTLESSVMGVHFKPGGAFPFLGVDADELRGRHTDLEVIWGRAAISLRERLCETASVQRRFRLLEQFLKTRLRFQRHSAVVLSLPTFGRTRLQMTRELAHDARLSEKRFIEVFRREVGVNPRLLTRICRFQGILARTAQSGTLNWAEIALDHGYFDQSHLIRDFLAFSGFSPAEYLRRVKHLRNCGMHAKFNHLPLAE